MRAHVQHSAFIKEGLRGTLRHADWLVVHSVQAQVCHLSWEEPTNKQPQTLVVWDESAVIKFSWQIWICAAGIRDSFLVHSLVEFAQRLSPAVQAEMWETSGCSENKPRKLLTIVCEQWELQLQLWHTAYGAIKTLSNPQCLIAAICFKSHAPALSHYSEKS